MGDTVISRLAIKFTTWSERWYPDSFVFAALAVIIVAIADLAVGADPQAVVTSFGTGFWTLVPFTMQMAIVVISGYVVAVSPPIMRLIDGIASLPKSGRSAVALVALMTMLVSFLSYAMSLVFGGLLVLAMARRSDLKMDYRAAAAAGYLGLGATWALGINSSAAMLQANPASLPKAISDITGVIPFSQTVGTWQSMLMALIIMLVSVAISYYSAPSPAQSRTAEDFGIDLSPPAPPVQKATRPGDWLERSWLVTVLLVILGAGFLYGEFTTKDTLRAISDLNTYNILFLMLGLLLHWRLGNFLSAVTKSIPSVGGILIQFPLYASTAVLLTQVKGSDGVSISNHIADFFVAISTTDVFPVVIGIYSGILGFLLPSGGGKWIVEAPYVMQAAKDVHANLGWTVQVYNAAEALPNLINPFWMLPLLGVLGLKAREIVGFTFTQFIIHVPLVLFLLWLFAKTLPGS
jgi:short-chain fatty acids transporter